MKCNRRMCADLPSSNVNMFYIKRSACCFLEDGLFSPWESNQRVFGHVRYRVFHVSLEGFMSLWTGNFSSYSYYWKIRFCFVLFSKLVFQTSTLRAWSPNPANMLCLCQKKCHINIKKPNKELVCWATGQTATGNSYATRYTMQHFIFNTVFTLCILTFWQVKFHVWRPFITLCNSSASIWRTRVQKQADYEG